MTMMILLSLGGVLMWASRRYYRDNELGFMSTQWLAEYRQNNEP